MGIRQAEFARRIEEAPPQLSRWVMNRNVPQDGPLRKMAEVGGVSVAWLRYGDSGSSEERPEDSLYDPREGVEPYDPDADTAELVFRQFETWIRGMGGEGDPAQGKLRRLDALEGLRRFFSARGAVPDWWYDIHRKVENGQL